MAWETDAGDGIGGRGAPCDEAVIGALAERLDASTVVTLDRRHFAAVKPRHREAFELLP